LDSSLARQQHEVPSPAQVEAAVNRINKAASITFELELDSWRTVILAEAKPLYNRVRPDLTIIFFKPVLLVVTPYMQEIYGWLAVSLGSLIGRGTATLMPTIGASTGRRVGFKPSNEDAEAWLRLQFARAMGARFRSHSMVKPDAITYTKDA
jgi:hypothetical protein